MAEAPFSAVKVFCTDAFGTIARLQVRTHPFRQLKALLQMEGAEVEDFALRAMSSPQSFCELASHYGVALPMARLGQLDADLRAELEGMVLYPEALDVLVQALGTGRDVVVASNLAWPYGHTLTQLLQAAGLTLAPLGAQSSVSTAYSYELGHCKPAPEFYAQIQSAFGVRPHECMLVGDRLEEDVRGPLRAGWAPSRLVGDDPARAWMQIWDELRAA